MEDKLTPQAKKLWREIPGNIQMMLLNNVYCTACMDMVGIDVKVGKVDGGDLLLQGNCLTCGHTVARVIESQ